ncbi:hypothetical protein AMAG_11920 [Allomyces macrogynus ATCC 38327]|uniref:Phosphatidate cytidylyltransferase n=1 Tax=Allomyces macrogynus (strain ATCC 38327) TaxID=578462 RepID=A0A0L0SY68_ALLM3|nr:hypothetical protein AMAG_11920 [Allomyces macrogynus ATCC 38327]|eukprot:KNE67458.1 hypothetical protein AMAG_11920 [Allomyces macrogynus ATCC 38327]
MSDEITSRTPLVRDDANDHGTSPAPFRVAARESMASSTNGGTSTGHGAGYQSDNDDDYDSQPPPPVPNAGGSGSPRANGHAHDVNEGPFLRRRVMPARDAVSRKQREALLAADRVSTLATDTSAAETETDTVAPSVAAPVELLAASPAEKKWRNWWTRTFWTLIMVAGFFGVLFAGPLWVIMIVLVLQLAVFREVIQIAHVPSKEKKLPWFRVINWYFLAATNYYLYGESVLHHFGLYRHIPPLLVPLATHHRFISFSLYMVGLVMFVLNLKRGYYKFQFSQFAWTHMALLLVVLQSHAIINNVLEGLIWFFLPVALVIVNDVFAYIFGFFFGKTPLIKLSPKKTWEGFLGGAASTLVFGFIVSSLLIKVPYFICPLKDLTTSLWTPVSCPVNPVFVPQEYAVPPVLPFLVGKTVHIAPLQFHALVMSLFASSIAPFGGFFASGVKRAFKIKDFGTSIPGHGGVTDRFDCQFIMGTFSYLYVTTFGRPALPIGGAPGDILQKVLQLSAGQQLVVYRQLARMLMDAGVPEGDLTPATAAMAVLEGAAGSAVDGM